MADPKPRRLSRAKSAGSRAAASPPVPSAAGAREKIVEYIRAHPGADAYDIAEALDLGMWEVADLADELVAAGQLSDKPRSPQHVA